MGKQDEVKRCEVKQEITEMKETKKVTKHEQTSWQKIAEV